MVKKENNGKEKGMVNKNEWQRKMNGKLKTKQKQKNKTPPDCMDIFGKHLKELKFTLYTLHQSLC